MAEPDESSSQNITVSGDANLDAGRAVISGVDQSYDIEAVWLAAHQNQTIRLAVLAQIAR